MDGVIMEIQVPSDGQSCPGGLFSVPQKNKLNSLGADFTNNKGDSDVQFRIRGLNPQGVYTIYIEATPYEDSVLAAAATAHQNYMSTKPVIPGTASFVPDNAAHVLSSLPSCFSQGKQTSVNNNNKQIIEVISIFEVDAATASTRHIKQEITSPMVNKKRLTNAVSMVQSNFLVKSGAKLIRDVSNSERAARLVKNGSEIIQRVSNTFVGKQTDNDSTTKSYECANDLPHAVPVSPPMPYENKAEQDEIEYQAYCESYKIHINDGLFEIEDSKFVKKMKDNNSMNKKFCVTCGVKTHRRNRITRKRVPLNVNGVVSDGRCLVCSSTLNDENSVEDDDGNIARPRCATLDNEVLLKPAKVVDANFNHRLRERFNTDEGIMLNDWCQIGISTSEAKIAKSMDNLSKSNIRRRKNNRRITRLKVMKRIRKVISLLSPSDSIVPHSSYMNDETDYSSDNNADSNTLNELLRPFPSEQGNTIELNFQDESNWNMKKFEFSDELDLFIPLPKLSNQMSCFVNFDNFPLLKSLRDFNSCLNKPAKESIPVGGNGDENLFTINKIARVLFVGKNGCGRSSLIRSLKSHSNIDSNSEVARNFVDEIGLQVHEWETMVDGDLQNLQLKLWDMIGDETQDLFFSNRAFYVLIWDMGRHILSPTEDVERELVDKDLRSDIEQNVISFLDRIVKRVSGAVVIPVLTFTDSYNESERRRRVKLFREYILDHMENSSLYISPPSLVFSKNIGDVISISNTNKMGIDDLQKILINIASVHRSCHHVGRSIPSTWTSVREGIESLRKESKICSVLDLKKELGFKSTISDEDIYGALRFLVDVGEISYFSFDVFSVQDNQTIFLRPLWLMQAIKNILRLDIRERIQEFEDSCDTDIDDCFTNRTNMPLIRSVHAHQLISSACKISSSTHVSDLVQRLLLDYDLMRSVEMRSDQEIIERDMHNTRSTYFYLPTLVQAEKSDLFSYKCKESWKKTICHTWNFRHEKCLPSSAMDDILLSVVQAYHKLSNNVFSHDTLASKSNELSIHRMLAWRESFAIWIEYIDQYGTKNNVEISARLVDCDSSYCIGSKFLSKDTKKLIVSGKGHINENDASVIWKGGYELALRAIRQVLEQYQLLSKEEIVCPVCLANLPIEEASSWSTSEIDASIKCHCNVVTCNEGHHVDTMLLSGKINLMHTTTSVNMHLDRSSLNGTFNITSLYSSVVLIALWDGEQIYQAGSGFIVDGAKGLIVSSSHTVINMENFSSNFGDKYYSSSFLDPKIVVGALQDTPRNDSTFQAVYRYCAKIVTDDVQNVDACVLRITSMFERDLLDDAAGCNNEPMLPLNSGAVRAQHLKQLPLTLKSEIEEQIAIVGYRQEIRIGVASCAERCNRSIDFSKGYIREFWRNPWSNDKLCRLSEFQPQAEIMVSCLSIGGYSGGPLVNIKGEVIGIVRAGDREGRQCYVVPTSEFMGLIEKAKTMYK